ncbi:MAG: hypothetical protein LBC27_03975 [Spirochaetaceae bacterium]|jgi:hypothetical protein|nr:hypothetical protein [Spirochaetaceae bacterium]
MALTAQHGSYINRLRLIIFLIFAAPFIVKAQTERTVSVTSSKGGSFAVVRENGTRSAHISIPPEGITLRNSDSLQTSAGVFVDIQIVPVGAFIHIAENTMISFRNAVDPAQPLEILLMYGRIRVDNPSDTEVLVVKSGPSTVDIQQGSINIDYIAASNSKGITRPSLSVSTISGTAILTPSESSSPKGRVSMKKGETVSVDAKNGKTRRRSMSKSVPTYWQQSIETPSNENEKQAAPDIQDVPEPVEPEEPMQPVDVSSILTPLEESTVLKTNGIIIGMTFLLAGVAVQNITHYLYPDFVDMFYAGYVPIGIGAFILVASYFHPTYVSESQLRAIYSIR